MSTYGSVSVMCMVSAAAAAPLESGAPTTSFNGLDRLSSDLGEEYGGGKGVQGSAVDGARASPTLGLQPKEGCMTRIVPNWQRKKSGWKWDTVSQLLLLVSGERAQSQRGKHARATSNSLHTEAETCSAGRRRGKRRRTRRSCRRWLQEPAQSHSYYCYCFDEQPCKLWCSGSELRRG